MVIEILYGEVANLHGDIGNIEFIKKCFKDATIIETTLKQKPYFVDHQVDFIYMGSLNEYFQQLIIEQLKPFISQIKKMIKDGVVMLFTGNSWEMLGDSISYDDIELEALNLFNIRSYSSYSKRYNSLVIANFKDIEIVGYKSQFSYAKIENEIVFLQTNEGNGSDFIGIEEGIHYNNCFCTYLLGPILVLNPCFTKYLFSLMGYSEELPFFDDMTKANKQRLLEFNNLLK